MNKLAMLLCLCSLVPGISAQDAGGKPDSASANATVEAYKPDGSRQCGEGQPVSPEQTCKALKDDGVTVLKSYKSTDGMIHPAVCGAATGIVNVCLIQSKDSKKAKDDGFMIRSVSAKADGSIVKSAGCTSEGVEAGCMVLTGFKDKKPYSLHFPAGNKPAFDTAIAFEGKTDIDTCMQGAPVNVDKWTPLKMKCNKPASVAALNEKGNKSMTKTNKTKNGGKTTEGKCSDWKAWHDRQPGHPATLHVTGKCAFRTGGYSVKLRPASPQGFNKQIYLLDRVVQRPTGPTTQVITEVLVHYVEKTSKIYTDAEIHPDGARVPVKEVQ